jgi:hypothetical protein
MFGRKFGQLHSILQLNWTPDMIRISPSVLGVILLSYILVSSVTIPSVRAQTEIPPFSLQWSSNEEDGSLSVAWGDYDNDGDLDLAIGNWGEQVRLYRNDNGMLTSNAVWFSTDKGGVITSVAWGDHDDDGDLDLAIGNRSGANRLYSNNNGVLAQNAVWSSSENDNTLSIAWGDYDNDGDLDLVAGNYGDPIRLYRNDNGVLTRSAVWSSVEESPKRLFIRAHQWYHSTTHATQAHMRPPIDTVSITNCSISPT